MANSEIIGAGQDTARRAPKMQKKNTFYFCKPVYEFNLPAGHSCPFALACKVCVNRETGKFKNESSSFRCYAASAERFPGVRENRWENFESVISGVMPEISAGIKMVRIHASGDFYSQEYFDRWLLLAGENPSVRFWAFTKSISFWINRINEIPKNLELQASFGGKLDYLIVEHGLKYCKVFPSFLEAEKSELPIDTNDYYAANSLGSFALVDNNNGGKKRIHALKSPAQNTMEICHTAPNSASMQNAQVELDLL